MSCWLGRYVCESIDDPDDGTTTIEIKACIKVAMGGPYDVTHRDVLDLQAQIRESIEWHIKAFKSVEDD